MIRSAIRTAAIPAAAIGLSLLGAQAAHAYAATAEVTFEWAAGGVAIGWTSNGANSLPTLSNDMELFTAGGNNSTTYYNADFAAASDYGPGNGDDCLTPLPEYESILLRKYSCRHTDAEAYYSPAYESAPVTDAGPGAVATGTLTVTDTTLTGTLTVVATTDEPTGATTSFLSGVRTSDSSGNGFDGYNIRTADGSPFGNAWYGVTTSATLSANLTGVFTATGWTITGGAVTFNDPGFACQQGGFGGSTAGTLCTPTFWGGGFQANGGGLSWGMDVDGTSTGAVVATPIEVRDTSGASVIAVLSGVLADLSLDVSGNSAMNYGEYRYAMGSGGGSCLNHIRWGARPFPESGNGIICGTLGVGPLNIVVSAGGTGDTTPNPFTFVDRADVPVSSLITSGTVLITGINTSTPISVTGGEYSIGCTDSYTAAPGLVDAGQEVCVRHTSAAAFLSATDTLLDVGGVTDTFTSTTAACDIVGLSLSFTDQTYVPLSTPVTSDAVTIAGYGCGSGPFAISVSGDPSSQYAIGGAEFTSAPGSVNVGDTVTVRHDSSAGYGTAVNTVVSVGGQVDTFTSTTVIGPPASGEIDTDNPQNGLSDIYSATFDGALTPCNGNSPSWCPFFGGDPPTTRNVTFSPSPTRVTTSVPGGITPAPAPGSRLNLQLGAGNGSVTLTGGTITLADLTITINGSTVVSVANAGLVFDPAQQTVPLDTEGRAEFLVNLAPAMAVDFSTLTSVVTSCSGPLCSLVPILSFDMVRYRLVIDYEPGFGSFTAQFIGQTANNSMLFLNLGSSPAQNGNVVTQYVYGSMANSVNTCFNIAVSLTGTDCSYARTRVPAMSTPSGPKFAGGFYDPGSVADNVNYSPVPGDGKIELPLTGSVMIDNHGTPADGADDLIGASWSFGPGVFNASTGNGDRAVERWDGWRQDMAPTQVTSATARPGGGFEYVIGRRGKPTPAPLCSAGNSLDCFPSENAPGTQDPPGFWDTSYMGLPNPAWNRNGIERSPGFGLYVTNPGPNPNPNTGAQTTGAFTGYKCVDIAGDNDCISSETLFGSSAITYRNENGTAAVDPSTGNCTDGLDNDFDGRVDLVSGNEDPQCLPTATTSAQGVPADSGKQVSPPGFDNVILVMTTDGAGNIIGAEAYWTREYIISSGPSIGTDAAGTYTIDNSWSGGRFTFNGQAGGGPPPQASPDGATLQAGTSVTIDVLANDSNLGETPLTVQVYTGPTSGTATVLPDNRIQYTSTIDYGTTDAFLYRVTDALDRSSIARVDLTLTEPPGPRAVDDNAYVFGSAPETLRVLTNDERLDAQPLTVTISRAPGDGTAVVNGSPGSPDGVTITYRSANPNTYAPDSFEYRVIDADGYDDLATVNITRYPNIAQDDELTVPSGSAGTVYVLQNDILPYEPPLYGYFNVGIYRNPEHGSTSVQNSPGYPYYIYVTYTPEPGFTGDDSFEYSVDNERRLSVGTVRVHVVADADADGALDEADNCILKANADQRDTDGDGFGNLCDADLDNSGFVNFADLSIFRQRFGTRNPDADFNNSGLVNFADLAILSTGFGRPPGPSGVAH